MDAIKMSTCNSEIHIHLAPNHKVTMIGDTLLIEPNEEQTINHGDLAESLKEQYEDHTHPFEPWEKEKKAFEEGKRIQILVAPDCWWNVSEPCWNATTQYRIHPYDR